MELKCFIPLNPFIDVLILDDNKEEEEEEDECFEDEEEEKEEVGEELFVLAPASLLIIEKIKDQWLLFDQLFWFWLSWVITQLNFGHQVQWKVRTQKIWIFYLAGHRTDVEK